MTAAWALDANHPFSKEPSLADDVRFAWRSLMVLCAAFGIDPHLAASRRRKDEALFVRKVWHYVTRPFINGTLLSRVSGYNRSTIEDDADDVERWRRRNALLSEKIDEVADTMEQVKSLIEGGADFLEELRLEREADLHKIARPLPVEQPPPPKPHAYVAILAKSKTVLRALGPIAHGEERPAGAMAWAHVQDSLGAQTMRIGWAGQRDVLEDAKPVITEALRVAGKTVTLAEVLSHPTLRGKYQLTLRVGTRVTLGSKPAEAGR
jgi:hypothetical protein